MSCVAGAVVTDVSMSCENPTICVAWVTELRPWDGTTCEDMDADADTLAAVAGDVDDDTDARNAEDAAVGRRGGTGSWATKPPPETFNNHHNNDEHAHTSRDEAFVRQTR
jgi:hypothetical protein